jgi:predicted dehydrogenase
VQKSVPGAKYYRDLRELLADDSIEAVSIATPNHWHSLAAIWALQAGKHVYVEKPISHNLREGRAVIEAAKKAGKMVQHGTQARSVTATREAIAWLHEGGLGKVKVAKALCYKPRPSIGKVDGPQQPPASCDYDLWTGPAELQPLMRKDLHYDWHWVFNTGNGDIGNQGVHQMDIARWGLGRADFPRQVVACGGRLGYDDDGNTPNTLVSLFDYGDQQLVFEVRGLKARPYKSTRIGVVFHCEAGYLVSSSHARVLAFDHDGTQVKEFRSAESSHFQNFLDAIKSGKVEDLNANAVEGHRSAALCHLGNIPYRLGKPRALSAAGKPFGAYAAGNESFGRFREHLAANQLDADSTQYVVGPTLPFLSEEQGFGGPLAAAANALLTRRYRKSFAIGS